MICPICGYESGVLENTPDGPMCCRCRDNHPTKPSGNRRPIIPDGEILAVDAVDPILTACDLLRKSSLAFLHYGKLNESEIMQGLSMELSEITHRIIEITTKR